MLREDTGCSVIDGVVCDSARWGGFVLAALDFQLQNELTV